MRTRLKVSAYEPVEGYNNIMKVFTRALTCLSKYGEELSIYGTSDFLALSATNSSKSAYCRFQYDKIFFSRFNLGSAKAVMRGGHNDEIEEIHNVTGQLLTKVEPLFASVCA